MDNVMGLRDELQQAADEAIQKVFDEYAAPGSQFAPLFTEEQLHLILAASRMISEAMILRFSERAGL